MLNLFATQPGRRPLVRRDFLLQVGGLAGLGLGIPAVSGMSTAGEADSPGRADFNCILVWTRGGTSHHDTMDPKPNARAEVRGEFSAISTALPSVQFTDQIPLLARHADQFAVVRNLNSLNGAHGTADAVMMSGWPMNPAASYPCYGSVVVRERGGRGTMPPFIQLGNDVDRQFFGGTAGYLGVGYNPFEVHADPQEPNFSVRDLSLPDGVRMRDIQLRRDALKLVDRFQRELVKQPAGLEILDEYYEKAFRLVTSPETHAAFDLSREPEPVRDEYGRSTFGQSCLLARRLIESGARFVTVGCGNGQLGGQWDTHRDNFNILRQLLPPFDQGLSTMLRDLKQRGLLERTLVVWLTDFGRTPTINPAAGRDHWASAGIAVFAGAGTPAGTIVGATDATGAHSVGREYFPRDIAATIYTKLGIPLDTTYVMGNGRPMRLCEGSPIGELM